MARPNGELFRITMFFVVVALAGAAFALAVVVVFTPAALALAAVFFCRRAALFLCIMPFLTALSRLLCASDFVLALGLFAKPFNAALSVRLVLLLRIAAFLATFTRFLADLIIGI